MKFILYTDGGARGNPGPGAIAVILKNRRTETIKEFSTYIGQSTNNEAEYKAVIEGLQSALEKGGNELDCYLDSELIVKQLTGKYKVKDRRMKTFWADAKRLEIKFKRVTYTHIPRSSNKEADSLVNKVLDSLS